MSGCSDAGELADRTARALSEQKRGEMSCLAGIGGRVKPLMMQVNADHIMAIDGCPLNCARHTLEQAGFQTVHHLELHRLGLRKESRPPSERKLAVAVQAGSGVNPIYPKRKRRQSYECNRDDHPAKHPS